MHICSFHFRNPSLVAVREKLAERKGRVSPGPAGTGAYLLVSAGRPLCPFRLVCVNSSAFYTLATLLTAASQSGFPSRKRPGVRQEVVGNEEGHPPEIN